ncbi:MAG: serine/threonine protein kinase, partial [Myxococcota bacterium]|nr:serine/threonine protein kinase [Myxococcota bacterium]
MPSPCPSHQTLQELLLSPAAQTEEVSRHVAGCPRCQGAMEALSSESGGAQTRTAGSSASGTARAFLPRGTAIGHYVLLEPLGAGGMGSVYAAYDAKLDRRVALKLLHPDGQGAEHAARLEREARAMARISHPNVLSVHELGNDAGRRFITMELVDGWTLGDWLGLERRGWRQVLASFRAAGAGLAAAHAAGLVHRDFKPANVLVSNDGRVRVTDFGLVRLRGEPTLAPNSDAAPAAPGESHALTQEGSLLGTPRYMAPEQLAGEEATLHCDQFSFCVALYEALYGAHPFGAHSLATLLEAMRAGPPPRPPAASQVPRGIHQALRRGLSHRPQDRWPGMPELLVELARDPGPRRRRLLLGGGAVAGLA